MQKAKGPGNSDGAATLQISIPKLDVGILKVRLVGSAPLICHAWSQKTKQEMLAKQTHAAASKKGAKDPQKCFEESLYKLPGGGYGFPATGLKSAIVDACILAADIPKTRARAVLHITQEFIKIKGTPTMREDTVNIGRFPNRVADLRYRGEFKTWESDVEVTFLRNAISADQLVNLIRYAGFAIGLGEWRPQKDGRFGTFEVQSTTKGE